MDKIWWNEAWMGWPVDESYERNSNVTHVEKLKGKLMLVVGELDTNVDPASTAQVVGALQKANKDFDYVPIMNAGHGAAETPYGKRRRAEFLVAESQRGVMTIPRIQDSSRSSGFHHIILQRQNLRVREDLVPRHVSADNSKLDHPGNPQIRVRHRRPSR